MRAALFIVSCAWLSTAAAVMAGPSPSDFRATATIQGEFEPNTPVRVTLSREIISEAEPDFADVRLFDDRDQETPYVIYRQTEAHEAPTAFEFEIVAYDESEKRAVITLKRPDDAPAFRGIELVITGTDFKKEVRVAAGPTTEALQEIATDTIFDFSSRIDLRDTSIAVPQTDAAFLRIVLEDKASRPSQKPDMRLRYEGLEFWTNGKAAGPIRVERILGWSGEKKPAENHFDHVAIDQPAATVDEDGNTVLDLGVRLPVAHMTFDVANPYYYRRVQLLTADENGDGEYSVAGSGVIYRMPGQSEPHNKVVFNRPTRRLRARVLNDDNPPLRVRNVEIAWIRRNLYLVPEPGRRYTLYVGSEDVATPKYELDRLIPSDHGKLAQYAAMSLAHLQPNSGYEPRIQASTREAAEHAIFVALVVALVCILGVWAYRLLSTMKTGTPEQTSGGKASDTHTGSQP